MQVLITGGAGFIGSHLAEAYLARGYDVAVIDDLSTGTLQNLADCFAFPSFTFEEGRVQDRHRLMPLVEKADLILHLAAAVGVKKVMLEQKETLENNISAALSVIKDASHFGKKLLFVSSSEVYGQANGNALKEVEIRPESIQKSSRWAYAYSKVVGETFALACFRKHRLPVVVVRLFNTVGPRQLPDYGMVLPTFLRQALEGTPLTVFGDGTQQRCFSFVEEIVDGIVKLSLEPGAIGSCVNLGSGEEISVGKLALRIKQKTKSCSPIRFIPYREAFGPSFTDIRRRIPDLGRAQKLIRYQPKANLDDILSCTIAYENAKRILDTPRPAILQSNLTHGALLDSNRFSGGKNRSIHQKIKN